MRTDEMHRTASRKEATEPKMHPPATLQGNRASEEEWERFRSSNGGARGLISRAGRRIQRTAPEVIALAAATGFLAGWLVFSRRRPGGLRELFDDSLRPAATRGMHDAYKALRSNRTFRDLRHRASKISTPW